MKELWVVLGTWWSLPVIVYWHGGKSIAKVTLAEIPYLDIQVEHLTKVLETVGEKREAPNEWWINSASLRAIARPAVVGAEESVMWNPQARKARSVKTFFESKDREDFLSFYADSGLPQTRAQAAALFEDFCRHALRWMMLGKCFDLGFAKLYPTPYRPDWTDILLELRCRHKHTYPQKGDTVEKLIEEGWTHDMMNIILYGATFTGRNKSLLRWGISVVPERTWARAVSLCESWRHDRVGKDGYLDECRKTIKALLPGALKVLNFYLHETSRPLAAIFEAIAYGPYRKVERLAAAPRKSQKEWAAMGRDSTFWIGSQAYHRCYGGSTCCCRSWKSLVEETERMLTLPNIRFGEQNLRDDYTFPVLVEPPKRKKRAIRLPLSNAVGK